MAYGPGFGQDFLLRIAAGDEPKPGRRQGCVPCFYFSLTMRNRSKSLATTVLGKMGSASARTSRSE